AVVGHEPQTVMLRLPDLSAPPAKLRIDLGDFPGYIHLHRIAVESREGEVVWEWDREARNLSALHDLAYFSGPAGSTWLSTAYDPYVELPLPPDALRRLSGARVVVQISWPMSSDHALAARVLSAETERMRAERDALS